MKVYACYLKVQKVEHWEIIFDDVQFITDSPDKAFEWSRKCYMYMGEHTVYHTYYYKEFELQ